MKIHVTHTKTVEGGLPRIQYTQFVKQSELDGFWEAMSYLDAGDMYEIEIDEDRQGVTATNVDEDGTKTVHRWDLVSFEEGESE